MEDDVVVTQDRFGRDVTIPVDENGNIILYRATDDPNRIIDSDFRPLLRDKGSVGLGQQSYFSPNPMYSHKYQSTGRKNYKFVTQIKPNEILPTDDFIKNYPELVSALNIPEEYTNKNWRQLVNNDKAMIAMGYEAGGKRFFNDNIQIFLDNNIKAFGSGSTGSGGQTFIEYEIIPLVKEGDTLGIKPIATLQTKEGFAAGKRPEAFTETLLDTPTNVVDDNLPIPEDASELEFLEQEAKQNIFTESEDLPINEDVLKQQVGARQLGFGDDELEIIEGTAFKEIMDDMDAKNINYSNVDIYSYIPESERLSPYLIFMEDVRNRWYTDEFVEYLVKVSATGAFETIGYNDLPFSPAAQIHEHALNISFRRNSDLFNNMLSNVILDINNPMGGLNPKKMKIKYINNIFPGGSYKATLEEQNRRFWEEKGMTPEGKWLPEVAERGIIRMVDADGNVTYENFKGEPIPADDPRLEQYKFDDMTAKMEAEAFNKAEGPEKWKMMRDENIITEYEYQELLKGNDPFTFETDTPTNVVDDINLTGTTGGNTNVKGNNIAYVDVEELYPYVQYDRRTDTRGMPDDYIDNMKKTIYEKGFMYDDANKGVNVFAVFFDDTGNVQINEGNHRVKALFEVAQETGQKIYVPVNPFITKITGGNKVQNVSTTNAYNAIEQLIRDLTEDNKNYNTEYAIETKLGEPGRGVSNLESYTYPGGAGGTSANQNDIKKFFKSIGINAITYDELPDNSIYKTGVNTFTDTPTNVVDYQDTGIGGRPLEIENGIPVDANSNPINSLGAADETITIYRVVPEGIDNVNANDWVFINKGQAEEALKNANTNSSDNFKIIELEVSKGDVYPSAKSANLEMGYFPTDTPTNVVDDVTPASVVDNVINTTTNVVDNLPLETVVKTQAKNLISGRAKNLATPGGVVDAVDVWEMSVLAMMLTAIAYKEYDEIPTIITNKGIDMFNAMTSPYNIPPVPKQEYDLDYNYIKNVLDTGEKFMPTDIIIKKVGDVVKGAAETGMVTGFGYVPTANNISDTIKDTGK